MVGVDSDTPDFQHIFGVCRRSFAWHDYDLIAAWANYILTHVLKV